MAENLCLCNSAYANTGRPDCDPIFEEITGLILVPTYADDGTRNRITTSATLNQAFWDAWVNNADASKRIYPITGLKEIETTKEDAKYQEFSDATKIYRRGGKRSVSFLIPLSSPALKDSLDSWRCKEFGLYEVDRNGSLQGTEEESGYLDVRVVDNESWTVTLIPASDANNNVTQLMVSFDYVLDEQDANLRFLYYSDLAPVKLLKLKGLRDIYGTVGTGVDAPTTTSFVMKVYNLSGSILSPTVEKGLTASEIGVTNETDMTTLVVDSVVDNVTGAASVTSGYYLVTVTVAQDEGDVLHMSVTKNGLDDTNLFAVDITIPVTS